MVVNHIFLGDLIMAKKGDDGRTVAILSYLTWVGFIVALILYMQEKTKLGGYHVRQGLLLWIFALVFSWIPPLNFIAWAIVLVLAIMGLISATHSEEKPMPIIGKLAQDWFRGL